MGVCPLDFSPANWMIYCYFVLPEMGNLFVGVSLGGQEHNLATNEDVIF